MGLFLSASRFTSRGAETGRGIPRYGQKPDRPILTRRDQQRRQLLDISFDVNVTFREAAEAVIRVPEPRWPNRKHGQQWGNTLGTYAYPVTGEVRMSDIDTAMIVRILQPIWTKKANRAPGSRPHQDYPRSPEFTYALRVRSRGKTIRYLRQNRDRGRPRGPTPPTPPCVRVRTRRFGSVSRLG
ncbi:phage integrase central domain-containing protein, partial [Paraburkholderia atlantica]|uniref:phage integrase central domain-containing protein n=1 Tax=Paraburkholderia atlantica TaxID=2654982 RepID=UPI004062CD4D